jgi:hypothetical protein
MEKLKRTLLTPLAMAAVMNLGGVATLSAEPPKKAEAKATAPPPKKAPKGDSDVKQKTPNASSKNSQASGSSDDLSANKKLKGIDGYDTPNPMESKAKTVKGADAKTAAKAQAAKPANTQEKLKQGNKR